MLKISEKLTTIAENVPKVYNSGYTAGQSSMVDESKLIPKTVSGSYISVDDVSEIPHNVACKISGVDSPEDVKVTRCGRNLLNPNNLGGGELVEYNGVPCYKFRDRGISTADSLVIRSGFEPNTQYTFTGKFYRESLISLIQMDFVYTDGTKDSRQFHLGSMTSFTTAFGKTVRHIYTPQYDGRTAYLDLSVSCLYKGTTALPYEPYNGQTLTPDGNGTVTGMTSVSPYMNIFSDTGGVNVEATYNKSYGMQTAYDEFWDTLQQKGNRTLYQYAFYGSTVGVWNNDNFKPKYPIKPINATQMLTGSGIKGDLTEIVDIDFSMAQSVSSALYLNRYITRVGTIDIRNVSESGLGVVNECTALETVDKVILKDDGTQYPIGGVFNFTNCTSLKNIVFEGKITFNINFKSSPLTKESITSVVYALYEGSTDLTATFNKSAKEAAFTDDEWQTLISTKPNWTFALL